MPWTGSQVQDFKQLREVSKSAVLFPLVFCSNPLHINYIPVGLYLYLDQSRCWILNMLCTHVLNKLWASVSFVPPWHHNWRVIDEVHNSSQDQQPSCVHASYPAVLHMLSGMHSFTHLCCLHLASHFFTHLIQLATFSDSIPWISSNFTIDSVEMLLMIWMASVCC